MLDSIHTPQGRAPEYEMIEAGGHRLRVARWAAPPTAGSHAPRPLLFFNGIGANIELMAPLADWMPNRDIITFDMPGIGGSPNPRLPYRPWSMVIAAGKVLDRYGYHGKVDVMGVSWGGGMAQQFAFQSPRRTGKLVLVATAAGMTMVPGQPKALIKLAHPRRYMDPEYMRQHFHTLYGEHSRDPASASNGDAAAVELHDVATAGKEGHISRLRPPSLLGYLCQLGAMAGWTSAPLLPWVRAKTLILMGEHDTIVPPINGRILKTLLPRARLEIVPGGHLFLISRPERAIRLLDSFLEESD